MTGEEMNLTDEERAIFGVIAREDAWQAVPVDDVIGLFRTISTLRTQLVNERALSSSRWQALVPFAAAAAHVEEKWNDASNCETLHELRLTVADLRRAAAILKEGE